ncbi:MAG: hypothetical protein FD143_1760 [Ignavibacteria bacterium]|nr:MAG: hypothetical protein FD143_1760 [Ignavibacteria bacterium]KAF0160107.1 MAG: hypothetical protein FD188_1921 [Ignavibacteria bacterium]
MKFLIDNNIFPKLAILLKESGYESTHLKDVGKQNAADIEIFEFAFENNFVIITADTDLAICIQSGVKIYHR